MAITKRGLVLTFLTTLILALIIFLPACYLAGKVFRTSTQAKDNYVEFARDIEQLALQGRLEERKSSLLIMDEKTAIVYFEAGAPETTVTIDVETALVDRVVHFLKPGQCTEQKNCLCLFRKAEFLPVPALVTPEVQITGERVLCTNVEYPVELESCSLGEAQDVNSYQCSSGFVIERNLIKEAFSGFSEIYGNSYYENPRRREFQLLKVDAGVRLIG